MKVDLSTAFAVLLLLATYAVTPLYTFPPLLFVVLLTWYQVLRIIRAVKDNDKVVILFFSFSITYSIYLLPSVLFGIAFTAHTENYFDPLLSRVLNLHLIALLATGLVRIELTTARSIKVPKSRTLLNFCFAVLLILPLFFKGQNIYGSSSSYLAYVNNLSTESGVVEYSLVFFALVFYGGTSRKDRVFAIVLAVWYSCLFFLMGYRVQMLMLLFIVANFWFLDKLKPLLVITLAMVGLISMELMAQLKNGALEFILTGEVPFLTTNQGDVVYTSMTHHALIQEKIFDFTFRLGSGIVTIVNTVVPTSLLPDYMKISVVTGQHYYVGGGGLFSNFLFVWFGALGVVLVGALLGVVINGTRKRDSLLGAVCLFILALAPRWYAYDFASYFIRLPVYFLVLCLLGAIFNRRYLSARFD